MVDEEITVDPAPKKRAVRKKAAVPFEETATVEVKAEEAPVKELPNFYDFGIVQFYPAFDRNKPTKLIVVGCGGTGGWLIPKLAQHICNHNAAVAAHVRTRSGIAPHFCTPMELVLIDMDIVETKNLKRQNFFTFDVGKNKAVALAERHSALFGINIQACNGKFAEVKKDISAATTDGDISSRYNVMIFDCTDNLKARQSVEESDINAVLVSCGNEDTFGQILVSTVCNRRIRLLSMMNTMKTIQGVISMKNPEYGARISHLPTLLESFRGFRDTEAPSCAEVALEEQSMPINSLVAHLAFNVFYEIMSGKPLSYSMTKCNVNNAFSTDFITNPFVARGYMFKGIFGFYSEEALERLPELEKDNAAMMRCKYDDFLVYVEKYDKLILPYMKSFMENSFFVTSEEKVKLMELYDKMAAELG